MTALADLVDRIARKRVAVIGDVMLDHFIFGHVDRISPEAPVPVVRFSRDEYRLGGAANVARNVAALGGEARMIGVIGDDVTATQLRQEMRGAGLDDGGLVVDSSRPTTRKVRVSTMRNQQVTRIDYESDGDVGGAVFDALVDRAGAAVENSDAVVLSDYRKGVVSPAMVASMAARANKAGRPLLVDPKVPQASRYRGASVVTPNHHEAELMTQEVIRTVADASRAARKLHEQTGASVLITWGEHGMFVFDANGGQAREELLPASAREVSDVTGAGDTVIAVLALGLAAGASLFESARLANIAAGLVVARFGPAAATAADLRAALSPGHFFPKARTLFRPLPLARRKRVPAYGKKSPGLVPEMPSAGEDHREAAFVGGRDHFRIPN